MIGPSGAVRVMLATRPVDFRNGMDGLAALVQDAMGADPFSGTVYVFRSKRGTPAVKAAVVLPMGCQAAIGLG